MIVNNHNLNQKIPKKLLPSIFRTRVVVFSFIASDDEVGITLYKSGEQFAPVNYDFDAKFDGKLKCKTVSDVVATASTIFENNRDYIKQAKAKFEDEFATKIELEDVKDCCAITRQDDCTVFEKQIFCIIKSCEEIEHTINPEFVRDCIVVPMSNINEFVKNNQLADYCLEFLYNFE